MTDGTLSINLKDTKTKVEEPKTFFAKIGSVFFGKKTVEQEVVEQIQYLQKIHKIFESVDMKNIVTLELNGDEVYSDDKYTEDDFKTAIDLALEKESKVSFVAKIKLQNLNDESDDTVYIDMNATHKVDEYPLVIKVDMDKSSEDVEEFLNTVNEKLKTEFEVEEGTVEVFDDDPSDEDESDEDESDEDESDEAEKEETKETDEDDDEAEKEETKKTQSAEEDKEKEDKKEVKEEKKA